MDKNYVDPKEKSHKICSEFLYGPWKNISIEEMKFVELKGGMMNKLYHCALPDSAVKKISTIKEDIPKEVLVRFYGPLQENKETLVSEVTIFTMLSERNVGPKLYGIFANGRLEQYLPSKSTSTWHDFSKLYVDVAKEMAKFHSLHVPIKKTPALEDHVNTWLQDFKASTINTPGRTCEYIDSGEYEREFAWLTKEVKKQGAKIVFCHNDLQGGNILLLNNPPKDHKKNIIFIDYEYSAYNYRGFDIANYFLVKCFDFRIAEIPNSYNFNIDNFPTSNEQEKFIDVYLNELQQYNKEFENDFQKATEKKKILEEISLLKLGPCLYWTIVTLNAGLNPQVEFPYWKASSETWELYKKFKEEFLHDKNFSTI